MPLLPSVTALPVRSVVNMEVGLSLAIHAGALGGSNLPDQWRRLRAIFTLNRPSVLNKLVERLVREMGRGILKMDTCLYQVGPEAELNGDAAAPGRQIHLLSGELL